MIRLPRALVLVALLALPAGCATDGNVDMGVGFYGAYWDDPWYWSGCCVDPPGSVGPPPPRPEHPIVLPDAPTVTPHATRPSQQPSATPRSAPSPRPAMRSGGGGGRGGGRR